MSLRKKTLDELSHSRKLHKHMCDDHYGFVSVDSVEFDVSVSLYSPSVDPEKVRLTSTTYK